LKRVIVLRGLPGSGKTTLVRKEFPDAVVCSADDFFVVDGEYQFNLGLIGQAHQACWRKFFSAVQSGAELVVVDNTATSIAEIAPYVLPAETYGYSVEIVSLRCDPAKAASRSVHDVPDAIFKKMVASFEASSAAMPLWWQHQTRDAE